MQLGYAKAAGKGLKSSQKVTRRLGIAVNDRTNRLHHRQSRTVPLTLSMLDSSL